MAPPDREADDTDGREAQARLTNMRTHEVSLVDIAANLRRFLLFKRGEMDPQTAPTTDTEKDAPTPPDAPAPDQPPAEPEKADEASKAVAMPGEAKQSIMDGLAAVLERLTGLAQVVGEAEVDDAATVPPDVLQMVGDVSMMLTGLQDQFTPAAEPPADEPPADDPTEQAKDSDDDDSADDETAKAGRKIAGRRLRKLQDLAGKLTELIHELGGLDGPAAKDQATAKADDADGEPEPDPVVAKLDELGASFAVVVDRLDVVEKSIKTKLDDSDDDQQALAKANEAIENLAASVRSPGDSNLRESEGSAAKPTVQWADDMAEEIHRKRAGAAS